MNPPPDFAPDFGSDSPASLAGQLIMIRFPGTTLDADTASFIRRHQIRAVCLFRANLVNSTQTRRLTGELRALMGPQALIALDQEGGAVVRATWLPAPPAALALGAVNDVALARAVGAAVARGIKALGFNWNFAPVLDLNNNLNNPVIAERSFGTDPERVAELAGAWMAGSLAEGVACCVKHMPGHGDTHVDSHRALPTVDKPLASLRAFEFAPFRRLAPVAPAMMTAHIIYPALDASLPATLSPRILTQLARDEWQFKGVIITDGMDMQAIAGHYGVGNAALMALQAGSDMVMALGNRETQEATLGAISQGIAQGEISVLQIGQRLQRLDRLAQRYPVAPCDYPKKPAIGQEIDEAAAAEAAADETAADEAAADHALMQQAWERALTAHRQPRAPSPGSKVRVVIKADAGSDGVSEAGLSPQQLQAWFSNDCANYCDMVLHTYTLQEEVIWHDLPDDGRYLILASTTRRRYGAHACQTWRPDLHLCLWNPFHALDIDAPAVISYGFAKPALQALAKWMQGNLRLSGKNPCLPPDPAPEG